MKKNFKLTISVIIILCIAAALFALSFFDVVKITDAAAKEMVESSITRAVTVVAAIAVIIISDFKQILVPDTKNFLKKLAWCAPCFLVVIANFPFAALISGSAVVKRFDLLPLFILDCALTGLTEELLFRGLIQYVVERLPLKKPPTAFFIIAVTSAAFALAHAFNIFFGAGVGQTLLQVGYCFLIGGMLSAMMIKTNNVWLCALCHAAFNFGGNLVYRLGAGLFQDVWFWIFTAVAGCICLVHVAIFLIKDYKAKRVKQVE